MPHPWDPDKIRQNLRDLAGIQAGHKFQYLDSGYVRINSFSILRGTRDSITDDRARITTVRLIREAVTLSRQAGGHDRVSTRDIEQALAGLERLRGTYPDGDKRRALDRLLTEARAELTTARAQGPRAGRDVAVRQARTAFYSTHSRAMVVRVEQHDLLGLDEAGVCLFFTIDWVRRILLRKPTYASSSKLFPDPVEDRLQRKVDKRLRVMQTSFMDWGRDGWDTSRGGMAPRTGFVRGPYPGMVLPVTQAKGVEFYEVVTVSDLEYMEGYEERAAGEAREGEGREVFGNLLGEMARQQIRSDRLPLFNVHLRGVDVDLNRGGGHVIGFDLTAGGRIHFFDCNFGEFQLLPETDREGAMSFFEDLWQYYAVAGLAVNSLWLRQWKRRDG